ncbi:MAG: roadblock/LC7 domain-containing protein [Anaerolineales bacterium]|jgi:predicted regulator of Ras-like GTPase activity (Roadblock/LC7/MglB family)
MNQGLHVPEELLEKIDYILAHLAEKAHTDSIVLADISGQVISIQGIMDEGTPAIVAALAAGDVAAMAELSNRIGEPDPHGSFFHEGETKSIYLHNIAGSFILIVIFRSETPIGLVRLFAKRAVEQLLPITEEFEEVLGPPQDYAPDDFHKGITQELDETFTE